MAVAFGLSARLRNPSFVSTVLLECQESNLPSFREKIIQSVFLQIDKFVEDSQLLKPLLENKFYHTEL